MGAAPWTTRPVFPSYPQTPHRRLRTTVVVRVWSALIRPGVSRRLREEATYAFGSRVVPLFRDVRVGVPGSSRGGDQAPATGAATKVVNIVWAVANVNGGSCIDCFPSHIAGRDSRRPTKARHITSRCRSSGSERYFVNVFWERKSPLKPD